MKPRHEFLLFLFLFLFVYFLFLESRVRVSMTSQSHNHTSVISDNIVTVIITQLYSYIEYNKRIENNNII